MHLQTPRQSSPMRSPCFVHSQLQGPSVAEWISGKHQAARMEGPYVDPIHAIQTTSHEETSPEGTLVHDGYEDEEETAGSLTKQLAETAVGVREMSKQLGMPIFWLIRVSQC
jgi:NAD+ kinase